MALPLLPTNIIHSVFYELSPSVLEINVLDAMATFYSYVEKQWIQKCSLFMVNSAGLIPKSRVSIALSANELVLYFRFFLFKLKSVGKAYQLEANQLREGILTRRYRRKMSKATDNSISKVEGKLATGCYSAQEILQIVSHVTEICVFSVSSPPSPTDKLIISP